MKTSFPVLFVYILALLLPIQIYVSVGNFPLSTSYILIGAAFFSFLLNRLLTKNFVIYIPSTIWPITLLLLTIIFYSFFAVDYRSSLISGVQVVAYCILYFTVVNTFVTEGQIILVVKFLLLGSIVNSLLGVIQVFVGMIRPDLVIYIFFDSIIPHFSLGNRGVERIGELDSLTVIRSSSLDSVGNIFRAFGWFGGPTVYSWFSTTFTVFALGIWLTTPRVKSGLISTAKRASVWGIAAIFLSWTRSAWLVFVVGSIFVFMFRKASTTSLLSKRWWKLGATLLLIFIFLILVASIFPATAIGQMILTSIGGADAASSNAGRLETAKFALAYIVSNPFGGVGFRNYAYLASGGSTLLSDAATEATAHNTYLELAVELGLLGVFAFIWLLIHLFVHARKLIEQQSVLWHTLGVAFSAVWITYAFLCMFGGNIVEPKWMTYIWMLAGLQFASIRIAKVNIVVVR